MTVVIIIAVTALFCGYLIVKEFQDTQETYNRALAENALDTNMQIVELRTAIQVLEQGINDIDYQHSLDISRLELAVRDQQNVIDTQQDQLDSLQRQVSTQNSNHYKQEELINELTGRVILLEFYAESEGIFYVPDFEDVPFCPYCGNYRYDPYDYPYYGP